MFNLLYSHLKKPTGLLISQIYFVKKLYMFRAVPLPIIRSFPLYIRHWYMSCRVDDRFQAWPRSWSCLKAVVKSAWHIPVPNVQWKTPDDVQRNCPKHVEFLDKKYWGFSASVGFIKKNFVTMHGHMNVKFCYILLHVTIQSIPCTHYFSLNPSLRPPSLPFNAYRVRLAGIKLTTHLNIT